MTFSGVEIPEILANYKFKQTPNQAFKNIFEVEGIEFATFFVSACPDAVKSIIERERSRKEALDKLLATKAPGFASGGMVGGKPESIIPLDKITQAMQRPDNRRRHMHVILSMLHECMINEHYSAAYYCSKPIPEIKAQFVKVLKDLCIDQSKYDAHSAENDIRFSNGSRLVFAQSMAFGDFHVIAPDEPKPFSHGVSYIGVDLARSMSDRTSYASYAKYVHGIWNVYNP